jgi:2-(1,2-epoxy-1,2-dihydrophenyl)acetyl-CoA isomerase
MPDYQTLLYEAVDGVGTLTLNRPQAKNSLSIELCDELNDLLPRIRADAGVRALVLTGAGGAFCSGGDVGGMNKAGPRTAADVRAGMDRYHRITLALAGMDKPVIAAIDGVAFGAGFSIALLCDIVLASDRARFCMVFQRIGLVPDMGALYTLPRAVGMQRARELMFSAREVGAAEAHALGIAMEVLPADALLPRAQEMARSFCGASGVAMAMTRKALQASMQTDLAAMLEYEATAQGVAATGDYLKEAARRFMAKEPAQFSWPGRKDA